MPRTKVLYPETKDFMAYQGNVLFWTGVYISLCFIGNTIVRLFGWFWGAALTPLDHANCRWNIFGFVLLEEHLNQIFAILLHLSPLVIIVFIGGYKMCWVALNIPLMLLKKWYIYLLIKK